MELQVELFQVSYINKIDKGVSDITAILNKPMFTSLSIGR